MLSAQGRANENKQYFDIVTDIRTAVRDGIPSIVEYHLNELRAMHMHTEQPHLRQKCAKVLAQHDKALAAATA